jgi:hypothetical protein
MVGSLADMLLHCPRSGCVLINSISVTLTFHTITCHIGNSLYMHTKRRILTLPPLSMNTLACPPLVQLVSNKSAILTFQTNSYYAGIGVCVYTICSFLPELPREAWSTFEFSYEQFFVKQITDHCKSNRRCHADITTKILLHTWSQCRKCLLVCAMLSTLAGSPAKPSAAGEKRAKWPAAVPHWLHGMI